MLIDPQDEILALQAQVVALLRAGASLVTADKETRTRVFASGAGVVFEVHDQLAVGSGPIHRDVLSTDAALLLAVRPTPDTLEGWSALARHLGGATTPEVGVDPSAWTEFEGGRILGSAVDGPPYMATLEGVVDRWDGGAMAPHARVQVVLGDATPDRPASAGPFCWLVALTDPRGGLAQVEAEVSARLGARMELVRFLDLSAPMPLDGGTWTARHADRYDTEGVGLVAVASLPDGRHVEVPVDLARPGTTDAARELPAARTRARKALLKALGA